MSLSRWLKVLADVQTKRFIKDYEKLKSKQKIHKKGIIKGLCYRDGHNNASYSGYVRMDISPMGKQMNKTEAVLKHLQAKGHITSWDAIMNFRATRLSAIIFNLRKDYIIDSSWETYTNQEGDTSRYVKYIYRGEIK